MEYNTPNKEYSNMSELPIINATSKPEIFYGLHFAPGTAQYHSKDGDEYKIFLNQETLTKMNPSFAGCPLYVDHKDSVDLANIQTEADGYVVESFYNSFDGYTWCKFIVVSDEGKRAIKSGYKLSNAYIPTAFGPSGEWHGMPYAKEILDATFEHLALVPNPRYAESTIKTPEEFKKYNANKKVELEKVSNSKGDIMSIFNFFKKTKVEISEDTSVFLPKTGKEMTLGQLLNEADMEKEEPKKEEVAEEKKDVADTEKVPEVAEEKKDSEDKEVMADPKHLVNLGEEKISVEELVKKHDCMKQELEDLKNPKGKEEVAEEKKDGEDPKDHEEALKKIEELEKHEEESIAEAKKNNFESIKNAEYSANKKNQVVELSCDKVFRGKQLFGSN